MSTDPGTGRLDFVAARALTKAILQCPLEYEWSLQGLGMLRLYLDGGRMRLHLWDDAFAVPNASPIHDHPWDFESLVIAGQLVNTRFRESPEGEPFLRATIRCGPGTCVLAEPTTGRLVIERQEHCKPGAFYSQMASELHMMTALPGTITIIRRTRVEANPDVATVWWKRGPFVSAEPRPATEREILAITTSARLRLMGA